ncbi:MAG: Flp family type IVb pilin [Bacillota bacterium]|nr:Flp family type IVb pilin [Bacillota bacterium]
MLQIITRLFRDEEGQGLAEYALILVLIAIAVIVTLTSFKDSIVGVFTRITDTMNTP